MNPDGSLDGGFSPSANGLVCSIGLQADGKILVGGLFTTLDGHPRQRLGRILANGMLDGSFAVEANSTVNALAIQAEGSLLVGGDFTLLAGQPRSRIGRLLNTEPATQTLGYEAGTITWRRGGTSPEVWRTTFEVSTDGVNWTFLGAGSRVPGGWVRPGATVPLGAIVRARGHTVGGFANASGGLVESLWTNTVAPPLRLLVESVTGPVVRLRVTGAPEARCTLQTTTNLATPTPWEVFTALSLTNGQAVLTWTNQSEPSRFFRAEGQP